ncbi:MAG: RecX family transcriptional regulator [candidate division Zixibacteria bacterium]|nr:RecX family transcriptional regulator [candidate division Zixibacteria bacterium]
MVRNDSNEKIDLLLVMVKEKIVTKIEAQKRNPKRRSVFIDGKFAFGLDEEVLYKSGLKKGESLTQRRIEEITEEERKKEAKDVALKFLSFRRRTEKQVKEKLKKKEFDEKTINSTIDKLKEFDLINDFEFATSWVKDRLAFKPRGKRLLKQELWKKGIKKDIIEQVTEDLCQDEDKSALQLVEKIKKRYKNLEPKVAKRRMYNLLLRRGFSYEISRQALVQLSHSLVDEEKN